MASQLSATRGGAKAQAAPSRQPPAHPPPPCTQATSSPLPSSPHVVSFAFDAQPPGSTGSSSKQPTTPTDHRRTISSDASDFGPFVGATPPLPIGSAEPAATAPAGPAGVAAATAAAAALAVGLQEAGGSPGAPIPSATSPKPSTAFKDRIRSMKGSMKDGARIMSQAAAAVAGTTLLGNAAAAGTGAGGAGAGATVAAAAVAGVAHAPPLGGFIHRTTARIAAHRRSTQGLGEVKMMQQLAGHEGVVWAATYSPDGNFLATAGQDGILRLWQTSLSK